MPKGDNQPDAIVLGEHPATYLAAALLRLNSKLRVIHATIPGETVVDRLVVVNPLLFSMHKMLESLKRRLSMHAIYGVQFLADDPATRSEHRGKSIIAHVGVYKDVRAAMMKLAQEQGVELMSPKTLKIHHLDESGVEMTVGKVCIHPKALVLGGTLEEEYQRMLGLPESWEAGVLHRYTFLRLKGSKWSELSRRPTMPMSLDLGHRLSWAWMLPHDGQIQLAVEQPLETVREVDPRQLIYHWAQVLRGHGILGGANELPLDDVQTMDLPFAGALPHEGVANRTVLIGPAGGFFSASGEDIYPNCWSAVFAADAVKKALKERHLQDALQPYRQRWRTTLGDYLRGPQQNLRFLLPLVYRNQVMTSRLAESIVLGKSLVR